MQGVDTVEVLEGHGHADDGQFGEGGEHTGQVCRSPGSSDDDAQAARGRGSPVSDHILGHAVGGDDADLAGDAEFGIACEVGVVSAHRMPEDMVAYGRSASARGLRVIIAGAGGAAHLPGMLAALTELPVIGVPVPLKHLDGVDSLHSIVQMPAGVPVATVSIAGARNAGLLAARILGAGEGERAETLRASMRDFQKDLRDVASAKGAALAQRVSQAR